MRLKPLWWIKWVVLMPTVLLALAYLLELPMDFITAVRDSPVALVMLIILSFAFVAMLTGGTAHSYRLFWSIFGIAALGLLESKVPGTSAFGDLIKFPRLYRWVAAPGVVLAVVIGAAIWSNIQYKHHLALIEDGKFPLADPLAHRPRLKRRLQAIRKRDSDEGTERRLSRSEKTGLLRSLHDTCEGRGSMI